MQKYERWCTVDGVGTRYLDVGQGPVILLVTGGHFGNPFAMSPVESWERNIGPLATRARVIVPEKLGQGQTDNPPNDDYTMQAVCRHLAAFLTLLDLRDVHLVGQSAGAMPVMELTRTIPERIRSCTIINSSTLAPGVGTTDVNLAGCPHPKFSRESQRWIFERSAFDPGSVSDTLVEAGYAAMSTAKYAQAVTAMQGGLKAGLFLPRLRALKAEVLNWLADGGLRRPTQIIWGCNDRTAAVPRAMELFRMISAHERQTTLHLINEAGHHPYREHPAHFNSLVGSFVETHSATGSIRA